MEPRPAPPTSPLASAPTTPPVAALRPGAASGPVLAVDDSAVVRAKLRKLLEGAGLAVTLARDGHEALACLAQQPHALLITDLEMPGMDGVALIGALQASGAAARLPILAISGHEALHEQLTGLQPIQGLFRKPWDDALLLQQVQALLVSATAH